MMEEFDGAWGSSRCRRRPPHPPFWASAAEPNFTMPKPLERPLRFCGMSTETTWCGQWERIVSHLHGDIGTSLPPPPH